MAEFEDKLRKLKELGGEYEKKIDAGKQDQEAIRKQKQVAAEAVKAKIKEIEGALNPKINFQVNSFIGESVGVKGFPFKSKVYLVKTHENEIHVHMVAGHNFGMSTNYMGADPDLLVMITDQKLMEFSDAILKALQ
jgi:hypothetical protein